jgi:O-acetyl-ADP-ribose deacetylase (regulator of RNase III)
MRKAIRLGTDKVSAKDTSTSPELRKLDMLPRGSALLTSAGRLKDIKFIIHAAPAAMTPPEDSKTPELFEPTVQSIQASIANSLVLAQQASIKKLAIPFVGGGIFLERLNKTPQELADAIVTTTIKSCGKVQAVFVIYTKDDANVFRKAVKRASSGASSGVRVVKGDITDFQDHGAEAIVNAANMEVQFGDGLSGIIAEATEEREEIDAEALAAIRQFWRQKKQEAGR